MPQDFTLSSYRHLLETLLDAGYECLTMAEFAGSSPGNGAPKLPLMLRHDVDRLPGRADAMSKVEHSLNLRATYFFRYKRESFNPVVIRKIAARGHEIGFHYEELSDTRGDYEAAWELFKSNLGKVREIAPVTSIAMHGRPFSSWDNRDLWKKFDYRELGITLEAYKDIPWNQFAYFTDTGRSWCSALNQRDRVEGGLSLPEAAAVDSTESLAHLLAEKKLPAVLSTHPERWAGSQAAWMQVYATDSAINLAKCFLSLARR